MFSGSWVRRVVADEKPYDCLFCHCCYTSVSYTSPIHCTHSAHSLKFWYSDVTSVRRYRDLPTNRPSMWRFETRLSPGPGTERTRGADGVGCEHMQMAGGGRRSIVVSKQICGGPLGMSESARNAICAKKYTRFFWFHTFCENVELERK